MHKISAYIIALSYFEVTFYRYAKALEVHCQDTLDTAWKDIQKTNPDTK